VDSSGFGEAGEPALTLRQFLGKIKTGCGYAITEAGQFQVYIGEFEKTAECRENDPGTSYRLRKYREKIEANL
jgi:hypothetical protein